MEAVLKNSDSLLLTVAGNGLHPKSTLRDIKRPSVHRT